MQWLDFCWRSLARASCYCALYLSAISSALAQQQAEGLAQGGDVVTASGIVRVVFVFLLVAGLAVGAAYAVRRYSPTFASVLSQRGRLRVIERAALQGGLRVHLVEADGEKVLIAESRAGVSMLRLTASSEAKSNDQI